MILKKQEIINLPVYTQSDQYLGKVVDFELSTNNHMIDKYIISDSLITRGILNNSLVVSPSQVISITNKKMIVEDTLSKISKQSFEKVATTA